MKTVKKYKTFEELASDEKAAPDIKTNLKKHADPETFYKKYMLSNQAVTPF